MKDVELDFDADGLVASDGHNTWHGSEFYKFLIDEAAVFFNADTPPTCSANILPVVLQTIQRIQ